MGPLKDFDSAASAQKLRAALWSAFGSLIFAVLGAALYGLLGFVLGYAVGFGIIYLGMMTLADRVGRAGSSIYMASGGSTPAKREYSLGDALVMQEKFDDAIAEYQRNAAMYTDDAEPRLRLARLYRDRLIQPEQAAHWFKQALALPKIEAGPEALAARELVELYVYKLAQPERAAPLLARLAERQASSPTGIWARAELEQLKQRMRETDG